MRAGVDCEPEPGLATVENGQKLTIHFSGNGVNQ